MSVEYDQAAAVVAIRGELDIFTAPELWAILDTVLDRGRRDVVLDLAELSFMDASGLRVIARGVRHLGFSGGALSIRSPSTAVRRVLEITGLSALVALEQPGTTARPEHAAPPGLPGPADGAGPVRGVALAGDDDDVVADVLRLAMAVVGGTVDGADAVSTSRRGQASMLLTGGGLDMTPDQVAARLLAALEARQAVAVAQGILMERDGVGEEEAYRSLRRSSLRTGRPLREEAEVVLASTRRRLSTAEADR